MTLDANTSGRIFLIGPMGAGKTTIGRQLARRLGLRFLDSDREIERRSGVDIQTIFDFEGESGFRQRERSMIDELTQRDGIVLATGGGAVLDPDNRDMLRNRGLVIHLATTVDEQVRRTRRDRIRPLLQNSDRRATLERLAQERRPLYEEIADITIETDGRHSRKTLERVLQQLSVGDE
jgi:shikimate kinase